MAGPHRRNPGSAGRRAGGAHRRLLHRYAQLGAGRGLCRPQGRRDGHAFVPEAFKAGAAAAIVARSYAPSRSVGALLRVDDPLRALESIGRAARTRGNARIVAITGSVGKTGTKEMLRASLALAAPTHAAEKSYNNHWGVP